jgi:hypothetical protein
MGSSAPDMPNWAVIGNVINVTIRSDRTLKRTYKATVVEVNEREGMVKIETIDAPAPYMEWLFVC